jgi:hypothetical protein
MTPRPGFDAVRSFSEEYARMNEGELLHLAASYDSLVEMAQEALRGEFARRKMEPPMQEAAGWDEVTGQELVTVRRYLNLAHAIVPKSFLESAGIFCVLQDENYLRLNWGASIALGGIRLQVRPEDVRAAEDLLSQPMPESIEYENKNIYIQPHCPRCGSTNVAFPSLFEMSQSTPHGGELWRCQVCDCLWQTKKTE